METTYHPAIENQPGASKDTLGPWMTELVHYGRRELESACNIMNLSTNESGEH